MGELSDMIIGPREVLPPVGTRVSTHHWEGEVIGYMEERGRIMWLVKRDGRPIPMYHGPNARERLKMEVIR